MPTISPPASPDARRAAGRDARLKRALRIAQLRRQVLATALSVFALAFGFVAFDGSMGTGVAPASTSYDGSSSFDGSSSVAAAPAPAPVQTSQS